MSYVRTLTICLLLVYFVSAAGCHCFDLDKLMQMSDSSARMNQDSMRLNPNGQR